MLTIGKREIIGCCDNVNTMRKVALKKDVSYGISSIDATKLVGLHILGMRQQRHGDNESHGQKLQLPADHAQLTSGMDRGSDEH